MNSQLSDKCVRVFAVFIKEREGGGKGSRGMGVGWRRNGRLWLFKHGGSKCPTPLTRFQICIRPGTTRKLSMPNQWARSHRLHCLLDISKQTINAKPMDTISLASLSTGHKHANYQCQTNRHDLIGFIVNWT